MSTSTSHTSHFHTTSNTLKKNSWNVAGLNCPIKRKRVLTHVKRSRPDITFLQETHWRRGDSCTLRAPWIDHCSCATWETKARGVAILFSSSLSYRILEEVADPEGRYLYISALISDVKYTFLNIYAPNTPNASFYSKLFQLLLSKYVDNLYHWRGFQCGSLSTFGSYIPGPP